MTPTYQIAVGHDNIDGLVAVVDVSTRKTPRTRFVRPGRRTTLLDGSITADGAEVTEWAVAAVFDAAAMDDFLAKCGLTHAESAEVTVVTPNRERSWGTYNATIYRPEEHTFERGRWMAAVFPVILTEYLPWAFSSAFSSEFE